MFGFRKKTEQPEAQLPYEVYETVHGPTARRRRWIVRLVAALAVVTLLIFGGMALRNALSDDEPATDGQTGQQQGGSTPPAQNQGDQPQPPSTLEQPPQQNAPLPSTGSSDEVTKAPQSDSSNSSTVRKPE